MRAVRLYLLPKDLSKALLLLFPEGTQKTYRTHFLYIKMFIDTPPKFFSYDSFYILNSYVFLVLETSHLSFFCNISKKSYLFLAAKILKKCD